MLNEVSVDAKLQSVELKPFARWLRCRAESAVFLCALFFLYPLLLIRTWRYGADKEAVALIHARWRKFLKSGLGEVRKTFWPVTQFEAARDIWFYILLIEYFAVLAAAPRPSPPPAERKILIIRFSHLGDVLHLFPMMRELRAQTADDRMDLLVGPWSQMLGRTYSAVYDRLWVQEPRLDLFERGAKSGRRPLWHEVTFLNMLRAERYTDVLATGGNSLAEILLMYALAPCHWAGMPLPALYAAPGEVSFFPRDTRRYEAECAMVLLPLLGFHEGASHLFYPLSMSDRQAAQNLLAALGIAPGDAYAVVCPGAGWPGKQWLPERFAELIRGLYKRWKLKIILSGSPGEAGLCSRIAKEAGVPVVDLAGKTDITQLAAIMASASLFVGNDSGPMHLAACFDIPFVVFFGPSRASKWAPRHQPGVVLQKEDCAGCISWLYQAECLHQNRCMKNISVEEALAAVETVLGGPGG